jgi:hypothetical protein
VEQYRRALSITTARDIDGATWDLIDPASSTSTPPPSESALAVARSIAGRGQVAVVWSVLGRMFAFDRESAEAIDGTEVAPGVTFVALPKDL